MTSKANPTSCRVCGNAEGNLHHETREMMFGTREPFAYLACAQCGCWSLLNIPDDLAPHYPDDYYSLGRIKPRRDQGLKHTLGRPLLWLYLARVIPGFAALFRRARAFPESVHVLSRIGIRPNARILDVGAGSGKYLLRLHRLGFSNLLGVDKFIDDDIDLGFGIRIRKIEAEDLGDTFDVVTTHHAFEHLPDPRAALAELDRLAKPGGAIVIRTPNADSWACREYGSHWFSLDPPRHLIVYTPRAIESLAHEFGLTVERLSFDAEPENILYSEQYRKDIPLHDPRSYWKRANPDLFSPDELRAFREQTTALNDSGEGDAMCIVLRKPRPA